MACNEPDFEGALAHECAKDLQRYPEHVRVWHALAWVGHQAGYDNYMNAEVREPGDYPGMYDPE